MIFFQNVLYMYILKVKKFQECAWMRLYNVKQNIEGNANLHHPPWNRVNGILGLGTTL